MAAEQEEWDRSQEKHRRTDKFTLHPRTFEEAVRDVWEAEPEERERTEDRGTEPRERTS